MIFVGRIINFVAAGIMLGVFAFSGYSLPTQNVVSAQELVIADSHNISYRCLEQKIETQLKKDITKPRSQLIEEVQKALERTEKIGSHPEYAKYVEIGEDLIAVGEYELAIKLYEKSIELYRKTASNTYNIGVCYFYLKDYKTAHNWLTETLKISESGQYYFARGLASHMISDYRDAIKDYESALKFDCNNQLEVDILNNLAWALYDYGGILEKNGFWVMDMYEKALNCIEKIYKIEERIANTPSHLVDSQEVIVYHKALEELKEKLEMKIDEYGKTNPINIPNRPIDIHMILF